jgi:hypothetical protein
VPQDFHFALVFYQQGCQDFNESRFPGAIRTQQRQDLPPVKLQRGIFDGDQISVSFPYVVAVEF